MTRRSETRKRLTWGGVSCYNRKGKGQVMLTHCLAPHLSMRCSHMFFRFEFSKTCARAYVNLRGVA